MRSSALLIRTRSGSVVVIIFAIMCSSSNAPLELLRFSYFVGQGDPSHRGRQRAKYHTRHRDHQHHSPLVIFCFMEAKSMAPPVPSS